VQSFLDRTLGKLTVAEVPVVALGGVGTVKWVRLE
jgi:hypothetical protein